MPEAGFYEDMLGVSVELFEEFQQAPGEIFLVQTPMVRTVDREHDVTPGTPVRTLLQAVAIPVQQKYVDGTIVTGRETQVMFSPPTGVSPSSVDQIEISGRARQIIKMRRIPDAGIAIVYICVVRD